MHNISAHSHSRALYGQFDSIQQIVLISGVDSYLGRTPSKSSHTQKCSDYKGGVPLVLALESIQLLCLQNRLHHHLHPCMPDMKGGPLHNAMCYQMLTTLILFQLLFVNIVSLPSLPSDITQGYLSNQDSQTLQE